MESARVATTQLKRAETTSSVGAGVLGAGLALLFVAWLQPYTVPILLAGLVMHAWGMYDKHRLEACTAAPRVWWAELLYWGCWASLAGLLVFATLAR